MQDKQAWNEMISLPSQRQDSRENGWCNLGDLAPFVRYTI